MRQPQGEVMSMQRIALSALAVALAGCVSTSNIDLSKVEPACGQQCSTNYSACGQNFTFFPIMQQNACVDALRLCAQACPAR